MDILKFIRQQRFTAVSLYALMDREQRKFSEKLAEQMLSEYSSPESTETDSAGENFVPPGDIKFTPSRGDKERIDFDKYEYIDSLIENPCEVDRRLLKVYEQQDKMRTRKWALKNPEQAAIQNVR